MKTIYLANYFVNVWDAERRVQISNSKPVWYIVDAVVKELMPDWSMVQRWKQVEKLSDGDVEKEAVWSLFTEAYLKKLNNNPKPAIDYLNDGDVVLCWCSGRCHRFILGSLLESQGANIISL